jgi:DNA-binding NarL/FixJ family response regulator
MNSNNLSAREIEILNLISKGETSKTIGVKLNISEYTVRAHRRKIFEKMEVRNMAELCVKAYERGLITSK